MQGDEIRVNGNALSWGSIVAKIDSERLEGFTAIGYGDKRERTKGTGMGAHQAPGRRSRGKYTTDPVKLKGYKASIQALRDYLSNAQGTDSYGDYEFELVVQGVEADETPLLVEIGRCVIVSDASNHEENADLLFDEIEIDCMSIKRNGKTLWDSSEGSPNG